MPIVLDDRDSIPGKGDTFIFAVSLIPVNRFYPGSYSVGTWDSFLLPLLTIHGVLSPLSPYALCRVY